MIRTDEKGSDVNLATYLLLDAFKGGVDIALLVSNDADLAEPVKIARAEFSLRIWLTLPCRGQPSTVLRAHADAVRPIRKGALAASQFPTTSGPQAAHVICDHGGDHMKTATVREFRDRATTWLKEEEPILVTRRGKIIGFFVPATGAAVPLEIKKDIFYTLSSHFRGLIKTRGLTEETVLGEFEAARSARRRR